MKEIVLFGKCCVANQTKLAFKDVNSLSTRYGFIVKPECCNERVMLYLKTLPTNYNSTFYKTWSDVTEKSRFELFIDQVFHYATTYGTDFQAEAYVPNENFTEKLIDVYSDYKVIEPISVEELSVKVQELLYSGIALSQDTIDSCFELINEFNLTIDVNSVKNKEILMLFCDKYGVLPTKPEEMVRYLVYKYTSKTLLIKDKETIRTIKSKSLTETSDLINKYGVDKLSSVFNRFKPLFLAMKSGNAKTINMLRKRSKTNHKAYEFGYFEQLLSGKSDLSLLEDNLKTLSNFKKVALLKSIMVRKTKTTTMPVLVRNQKMFVKELNSPETKVKNFFDFVFDMIYNSLVESLSQKACKVKLNDVITLAVPTSEKNFIGNVPYGSYLKTSEKNTIVGINWKSSDGANDLDLSFVDENLSKIGWNSIYYSHEQDIVYSGDVTYANPEATELILFKKGVKNGLAQVNLFSGMPNSKYTLFFAQQPLDKSVEHNKMVDVNDILFSVELSMDSKEMLCGYAENNKFYFANIRKNNKRVSSGTSITKKLIDYTKETQNCVIPLEKLLKDSGFEMVDSKELADIDLTNFDKSSLISLLA